MPDSSTGFPVHRGAEAPPFRVGLIGFGYAGQTFHAPLIGATDGLVLAAVASIDAGKVHAALGAAVEVVSTPALIGRRDIDLIVVATPNESHHHLALAAIEAGHHVVVDKPFALDAVQAGELVDAAERRQRVLSVFHNRRWDSDFLCLSRIVETGALGRPVELISHFDRFRPWVGTRWREGDGAGSGLWLDLGPHLVDQALRLFGAPAAIWLDRARLRDGALSDDWFSARLRWVHGPFASLRATLAASMLAAHAGPRFTLHCTGGSFSVDGLDPQEAALKAGASPASQRPWGVDANRARVWRSGDEEAESVALPNGAYPTYYAALRDAIHGKGESPVPARQALAVQRVLDAGIQSDSWRAEVALTGA